MGVSTYVIGIRDLDGRFDKMWKIKEQCQEAEVSLPVEVKEYFEKLDSEGYQDWDGDLEDIQRDSIENSAREVNLNYDLKITRGDVEYSDGMEFDVADIPDYVKTIRVFMQ
jgi:hypothetical protein